MELSTETGLSRRNALAVAGAALTAAAMSGASEVRAQGNRLTTFVLVHPAWFGGWCWQKE